MIFSLPVNNNGLYTYYRNLVEMVASHPPIELVSLLPIDSDTFQPHSSADCSSVNIGVYIPENGQITSACLNPSFKWDMIVVPSYWLEYQLKIRGISNVVTVLPGCAVVPASTVTERSPDGRFVVASNGRFSLHQGNDLLLAVMRQFMADHADCWFACDWELTSKELDEVRHSPHCDLEGCVPWDLPGLLVHNGIDPARIVVPAAVKQEVGGGWGLVASSDVYVSSARVLLGTDVTFTVFSAAGKPALSFEPLDGVPVLAPDGTTVWFEPAVSVVLERLEFAYKCWSEGKAIAPVQLRSWSEAADELYRLSARCRSEKFPAVNPLVSVFTLNKRGAVLASLALYDAALDNYHKALALEPLNPETFNCIGNLMDVQEKFQDAILYFDKAISLDRRFVAAYFNKATTLKQMQCLDDAIDTYQSALQIDPRFGMGWLNMAIAFALNNQLEKADECFRKTLELEPENTDALFLWGNQLLGQQELEKALECYERVLALEPDHYLTCNSMGIAYLTLMEAEKAYNILRKVLLIKPDMTSAMTNIGTACRDMDRLDEAVSWYDRALAIEPDDPDTHWNLALALLHQGEYERGWQEYEWRFQKSDKIAIRPSSLPLWDGSDLQGKTIVIQAEQGYGDTIQFMRYALLVASGNNSVILECQDNAVKPLVDLLPRPMHAISCLENQPAADVRIPLLSLPLIFKTRLDSIPFPDGYLTPPADQIAHWRRMIDNFAVPGDLRIGFVWDGRKTFRNDKRSIPLEKLTPLFGLDGVAFISLQKGEQSQQLKPLCATYRILDISEQLMSFADTAALIAGLDLAICVDTSVAHLAAAVGCPTWVMLKVGPDWRWLEQRTDSPWYSSVRLYRQQRDGQWDGIVEQICSDVKKMVAAKKTS